jgi:hypothetical protein
MASRKYKPQVLFNEKERKGIRNTSDYAKTSRPYHAIKSQYELLKLFLNNQNLTQEAPRRRG